MQSIHHVIVTALKSPIHSGGLEDREFEGAFQEGPTILVRVGNEGVISRRRASRNGVEPHRKRASREVVCAQIAGELHIEPADSTVLFPVSGNSENGVDAVSRV